MCGIVGYIGHRTVEDVLIEGLKRLEYRGYDSAGIAISGEKINLKKIKGSIKNLENIVSSMNSTHGIGHTRWATHGEPSDENAHPFIDCSGEFAIVHNGIIENYMSLRDDLIKKGHKFSSETDSEVVAHIIEDEYKGDFEDAVKKTIKKLEGSFALVFIHKNEKKVIAARYQSPLVIGIGKNEFFVASDVPAFLSYTDRALILENGEMAVMNDRIKVTDFDGNSVNKKVMKIEWSIENAEKSGYEHFMLKEIFEQPNAILQTMRRLRQEEKEFENVDSIKIIACGTSYYAGLVGKYVIEDLLKIPVEVDYASEYRYKEWVNDVNPLIIFISQSGETADTLAAIRLAKNRGLKTIGITNVVGSSITREVDDVLFTFAGPEIGVAATKSFTTQIIALYHLAIFIGISKDLLDEEEVTYLHDNLRKLPRIVDNILDRAEEISEVSKKISNYENMFFIGRHINFPIAMEGALKMKEISYIHAEGYSAGELKHGPLALLTENTPVIAIAPTDKTYNKILGNIKEVSARKAPTIAVGFDDNDDLEKYVNMVIHMPMVDDLFTPIPIAVVLQLLAYYTAKDRGCEIDKPRNLAKSVTVE